MAGKISECYVEIRAPLSALDSDLRQAVTRASNVSLQAGGQAAKSFGAGWTQKIGSALGLVSIGALFYKAGRIAIDSLHAAIEAKATARMFAQVFAGGAAGADEFAHTLATTVSAHLEDVKRDMADLRITLGQFDMAPAKANALAAEFEKLSYQMSAFFLRSPQDISQAIQMALMGNTRTLRQYGISIKDVEVKTQALKMGLIEEKDELDMTTAMLARAVIMQEKFAGLQVDMATAAGELPTKMRAAATAYKDMLEQMGKTTEQIAPTILGFWTQVLKGWERMAAGGQRAAPGIKEEFQNAVSGVSETPWEVAKNPLGFALRFAAALAKGLVGSAGRVAAGEMAASPMEILRTPEISAREKKELAAETKKSETRSWILRQAELLMAEKMAGKSGVMDLETKAMQNLMNKMLAGAVSFDAVTEFQKAYADELDRLKEKTKKQTEAMDKATEALSAAQIGVREKVFGVYGKMLPGEETHYTPQRYYRDKEGKLKFDPGVAYKATGGEGLSLPELAVQAGRQWQKERSGMFFPGTQVESWRKAADEDRRKFIENELAIGGSRLRPGASKRFEAFMEARETAKNALLFERQTGMMPGFMDVAGRGATARMEALGPEFFGRGTAAVIGTAGEVTAEEKQLKAAADQLTELKKIAENTKGGGKSGPARYG